MLAALATRAGIMLIKSGKKEKVIWTPEFICFPATDIMWQTALHFPTQSWCEIHTVMETVKPKTQRKDRHCFPPEDEILPIMLLPYCLQFPKLWQCQNYFIPSLQWHLPYTMLTNFFQQVSSATLSNYLGTHTILKSSTFGCVPGTSPFQCVH